jgi:hypothetical protein
MQFVFHASAHAVKGANKAQDPRGVNGHGEGSTDESGRCGTTLSKNGKFKAAMVSHMTP